MGILYKMSPINSNRCRVLSTRFCDKILVLILGFIEIRDKWIQGSGSLVFGDNSFHADVTLLLSIYLVFRRPLYNSN